MTPHLTRAAKGLVIASFVGCAQTSADDLTEWYGESRILAESGTEEARSSFFEVVDLNLDGADEVISTAVRGPDLYAGPSDVYIHALGADGEFGMNNAMYVDGPLFMQTGFARAILTSDFNGDGYPDVFFDNHGHEPPCPPPLERSDCFTGGPNLLLLSDGQGKWFDASPTHLPTGFSDFSHGSSAGDFDGDGDIDLWINNLGDGWPDFEYLMANDGAGRFEIVADFSWRSEELYVGRNGILPQDAIIGGGWSVFFDAEGDGDFDLTLTNAGIWDSQIEELRAFNMTLINQGSGTFTRLPVDSWPKLCAESPHVPDPAACQFSQAGVQPQQKLVLDVNRDGLEDIIFKQALGYDEGGEFIFEEWVQLLISNGDGTFSDETEERIVSLRSQDGIGLMSLHDLDNDGSQDFFVYGYADGVNYTSISINDGEGYFREMEKDWFPAGGGHMAVFDMDGDGGSDFLYVDYRGLVLNRMIKPYGPDLDGDETDDRLVGGALNNVFRGMAGDDLLDTGLGDDQLDGGPGNDTLLGGKGNDRYVLHSADLSDHDTIFDKGGSADRIEFADFEVSAVSQASQGPDGELILAFGAGGSLTVQNHFQGGTSGVEKLQVGDDVYDVSHDPAFEGGIFESLLIEEGAFPMEAGLNGNWWNGPQRSGEGAQIEIADGGGASKVFVATIYSYDDMGNQVFLVAVGPVTGDTAEVDVFITDGGVWGDGFDPALVNENQWGTGTFTSDSCEAISMELRPNAEYQAQGYSDLSYGLIRLTTPVIPCPFDGGG